MKTKQEQFMDIAVQLSDENLIKGGGPFGAIIVKDGLIISKAANSVTIDNDPTAHAEVNAIRQACKVLNTFDLSGCEIYTSCEPCPMCYSAISWSRIDTIYYANTAEDAGDIGFDDKFIYDELKLNKEDRTIKMIQLDKSKAIKTFENWKSKEDKTEY